MCKFVKCTVTDDQKKDKSAHLVSIDIMGIHGQPKKE